METKSIQYRGHFYLLLTKSVGFPYEIEHHLSYNKTVLLRNFIVHSTVVYFSRYH